MNPIELTPAVLVLIPVVIGLTSLSKIYIDAKWSALVALILGVAGSFLFPAATAGITILSGVVIGLSASGLYSGVKSVVS